MKIKRKTLHAIRTWALISVSLAVIASFLYIYYRTPTFTITSYQLEGFQGEDAESIVKDITEQSSNYSYFIFPNNKIGTYSKDTIQDVVVAHVPDIRSIRVRPQGLNTLHVKVTRNVPLFKIAEHKGINEEGIVFRTNKDLGVLTLLSVASSTEVPITIEGISFTHFLGVDKDFLDNLQELENKVGSVIFQVHTILLDPDGDVSFLDDRGISKVMLKRGDDMKKTWSTLVSAIDTEPLRTKLHSELTSLQYIDVRFGNKVFYKFGAGPLVESTSTAIMENHDEIPLTASTTAH